MDIRTALRSAIYRSKSQERTHSGSRWKLAVHHQNDWFIRRAVHLFALSVLTSHTLESLPPRRPYPAGRFCSPLFIDILPL